MAFRVLLADVKGSLRFDAWFKNHHPFELSFRGWIKNGDTTIELV